MPYDCTAPGSQTFGFQDLYIPSPSSMQDFTFRLDHTIYFPGFPLTDGRLWDSWSPKSFEPIPYNKFPYKSAYPIGSTTNAAVSEIEVFGVSTFRKGPDPFKDLPDQVRPTQENLHFYKLKVN